MAKSKSKGKKVKAAKRNCYSELKVIRTVVGLEDSDVTALKKVVAICCGTKNYRSIDNVFGKLIKKGWLERVDSTALRSTQDGRAVAGNVPPLTAEHYHSKMRALLTNSQAEVLVPLLDGAVWDRQTLKTESGKGKLTQESFDNLVSALKNKDNGFVKEVNGRKNIQLSELALHLGPSRYQRLDCAAILSSNGEGSESPNMAAV